MTAFDYQALDAQGRVRRGIVSAESARLARRELRQKALVPLELVQAGAERRKKTEKKQWVNREPTIGVKELSLVTRQLATMVEAAAPVEEALNTIALQSDKPVVRRILLDVRSQVMEGYRLSAALARHPKTFSPLYRSMVAAGDASGSLAAVLERLADHMERAHRLRAKVAAALVYPSVLAVAAIAVVVIMMTFFVPKVVEQFESIGQELPGLTLAMIALSEFLQDYGLALLAGLVMAAALFIHALRRENVRYAFDRVLFKIPIVGGLFRGLHAARLARTLSTLVASGTPVLEGLAATRQTATNLFMREAVANVESAVRDGTGLSDALRRTGAFPPMVVYMVAVGERSGQLEQMLNKAAEYLETAFEDFTATTLSLLEPGIIIVMGIAVATIVLAILLPILRLNSLALL